MTERTRYTDLIRTASAIYGLPMDLVEGQVLRESDGDANAFRFEPAFFERYIFENVNAKASHYGPLAACSFGLMQIMLETAYELGFDGRPEQLFEPRVSLAWGCKYMQSLLAWAKQDYGKALAAYNAGRGTIIAKGGPPWPNQKYVNAVYKLSGRNAAA